MVSKHGAGKQSALIEARVERRNALTVLLAGTPWSEANERAAVPDDPSPMRRCSIAARTCARPNCACARRLHKPMPRACRSTRTLASRDLWAPRAPVCRSWYRTL